MSTKLPISFNNPVHLQVLPMSQCVHTQATQLQMMHAVIRNQAGPLVVKLPPVCH